jgi:hypothetical protein
LAAKKEAMETEREGKPGKETARALIEISWWTPPVCRLATSKQKIRVSLGPSKNNSGALQKSHTDVCHVAITLSASALHAHHLDLFPN